MNSFDYSQNFEKLIIHWLREKECLPLYQIYLKDYLGGVDSRVVRFCKYLCPEIEFRCGSLKNKKILDFGCGTGPTTAALAEFSEQVYAFDIDEESIEICKQRIYEHGLQRRVKFYCADSIDKIKNKLGTFDLILVNGVIEHIPITKIGLRKKIMLSLFQMLKKPGYLFINETPNRLFPFDFHTTLLWWIPWSKAGSNWAYKRALKKKRYYKTIKTSQGPLGLEEWGAWGATYWEILKYFKGEKFVCLNNQKGHDRYLNYMSPKKWEKSVFEFIIYYFIIKLLHIQNLPITAFYHFLLNIVIMKY